MPAPRIAVTGIFTAKAAWDHGPQSASR